MVEVNPSEPAGLATDPDGAHPSDHRIAPAVRVRFSTGDPDALATIYDRYARGVWAVAVGITRADHLAQEAVQETFIRAWQAAGTYDPARDVAPWLFAIARFTSLDLLRRELRPTRGGHEIEQDQVVEGPGLDRAWLSWSVQEALRRLGDQEREIVRLSFYEDLTHVQIAERLGLPIGTVKSRSHRAHRRLAEMLAHVRDEPRRDDPGQPVRVGATGVESQTGANPKGLGDRTINDNPAREGRNDP